MQREEQAHNLIVTDVRLQNQLCLQHSQLDLHVRNLCGHESRCSFSRLVSSLYTCLSRESSGAINQAVSMLTRLHTGGATSSLLVREEPCTSFWPA